MLHISIEQFSENKFGIRLEDKENLKVYHYSFEKNQIEEEFYPDFYQVKLVKKEFIARNFEHAKMCLEEMKVKKGDKKYLFGEVIDNPTW